MMLEMIVTSVTRIKHGHSKNAMHLYCNGEISGALVLSRSST
jgi:hypothetical protein